MKANKRTIIVCVILTIILLMQANVLYSFYDLILNFLVSLCSGFLVSVVNSLVGYYSEKEKIKKNIYNNIYSLYINLLAIKSIMGEIVPKVNTADDLTKLDYETIASLSSLNKEFIERMNLESYNGFFKNSKLSQIIDEFIDFKYDLYNLENLSYQLRNYTYSYQKKELDKKLKGQEILDINIKYQDEYKNMINVKTAKFHEYEAGLIVQLDKLAEKFIKVYNPKLNWNELKNKMQQK